LNRLAELLGGGRIAWAVAVPVMSVLFGVIHLWQGLTGAVTAIKAGLIFGGLYLIARRNLWLPLITHGVYDTAALILIFLGIYPGM
jgi:membrane protease YdiL (CAAX protease family)